MSDTPRTNAPAAHALPTGRRALGLRLIIAWKLTKGSVAGVTALLLATVGRAGLGRFAASVQRTLTELHLDGGPLGLLARSPTAAARLVLLLLAGMAVLHLTEAAGLWRERRWADWLATIATSLLIPPGLYQLVARPSAGAATILLVNLAIVGYLGRRVMARRRKTAAETLASRAVEA